MFWAAGAAADVMACHDFVSGNDSEGLGTTWQTHGGGRAQRAAGPLSPVEEVEAAGDLPRLAQDPREGTGMSLPIRAGHQRPVPGRVHAHLYVCVRTRVQAHRYDVHT